MADWKDWLATAERDLKAAESLGQAGYYEHGCFWCQQSAEKSLKALLLLKQGKFPKIHSLSALAKQAGVLTELNGLIADLDSDYTTTRYMDLSALPKHLYGAKDFKERLAAALKVFEKVQQWTKS